jgi:glucose-6-phosphate 1-dehydrogenase
LGATGDLSRWKLIPAIGNLAAANRLPSRFAIVGFAFDPLTTESFHGQLNDEIQTLASSPIHPEFCQSCSRALSGSKICDGRSGWAPPFFAR